MQAFEVVGRYVLDGVSNVQKQINRVGQEAERSGSKFESFGRDLQSSGRSVSSLGAKISMFTAGAVAGLSAAFVSLTKNATDFTRELRRQSEVTGESIEGFQKQSFAAEAVGVSAEKYGDVLKDVQDRVGDFLATGGGPMTDFFENIAPKVGVTADQFRGLSGKDALQLFVTTLERAGVSSQEMTFHMEALAGDASSLTTLFRNGGEELDRLSQKLEESGAILSEDIVNGARASETEMKLLSRSFEVMKTQIGIALFPIMRQLTTFLINTAIPNIKSFATTIISAFTALPEPLQAFIGQLSALAVAIGPVLFIGGKIVSVFGTMLTAFSAVKAVVVVLAGVMSPFIGVILAVVAGVTALVALIMNWDAVMKALGATWEWITGIFTSVKDAIVGAVSSMVESVVDYVTGLVEDIGNWFAKLPGRIVSAIVNLPSAVMNVLTNLGRRMANWASEVVGDVVGKFQDMYQAIVGNSIVPDMRDEVDEEFRGMASDSDNNTRRLASSVNSNFRDAADGATTGASSPSNKSGSSGGGQGTTIIDMRNSVFRDDKDLTDRLQRRGQRMTGGLV